MLCDLEAELVDDAGESIGSVTLHEGDEVFFFRTDRQSYADLRLADGSVARVYITLAEEGAADWRPTIDGVPVDSIFDGMYWI